MKVVVMDSDLDLSKSIYLLNMEDRLTGLQKDILNLNENIIAVFDMQLWVAKQDNWWRNISISV